MDVMTALAAVSHAIDGVRKLREIERDFDAAAYRLQIADLTSSLADAKLVLTDVQQEIGAQKSEIARLKEALRFQGKTVTVMGQVYESGQRRSYWHAVLSCVHCRRCCLCSISRRFERPAR